MYRMFIINFSSYQQLKYILYNNLLQMYFFNLFLNCIISFQIAKHNRTTCDVIYYEIKIIIDAEIQSYHQKQSPDNSQKSDSILLDKIIVLVMYNNSCKIQKLLLYIRGKKALSKNGTLNVRIFFQFLLIFSKWHSSLKLHHKVIESLFVCTSIFHIFKFHLFNLQFLQAH